MVMSVWLIRLTELGLQWWKEKKIITEIKFNVQNPQDFFLLGSLLFGIWQGSYILSYKYLFIQINKHTLLCMLTFWNNIYYYCLQNNSGPACNIKQLSKTKYKKKLITIHNWHKLRTHSNKSHNVLNHIFILHISIVKNVIK